MIHVFLIFLKYANKLQTYTSQTEVYTRQSLGTSKLWKELDSWTEQETVHKREILLRLFV